MPRVALAAAFAAVLGLLLSRAGSGVVASQEVQESDPGVERGRYLVHHVAMCVQCHSPRDGEGNLVELRLLEGGTIPVESPYPDIVWGFQAPQLRGLPGWEPEQVVTLLMTGHRSNGRSPRPPMPPFRLSEEDARAIVAYLKSIG